MAILTTDDYPAVRAALDVKLTRQELPDDVIGQSIFVGAAEDELIARVPDAESKTGDDLVRMKRAAIYLTAARLAHSVVRITSLSTQTRDLSFSRQAFDPDEMAAYLRGKADLEINAIQTPSDLTPSMPTMFTTAKGRRGK